MKPWRIGLALAVAAALEAGAARADEPSAPSPEAQAPPEGVVRLHVEANSPDVEVRQYHPGSDVLETVCRAPCDRLIDARDGRALRFDGEAVSAEPLPLARHRGDVTAFVTVRPGLRIGGAALTALGSVGLVTALILLGGGLMSSGTSDIAPPTETWIYKPLYVGAAATGTASALALAGGITMLVLGKTTYDIVPGADRKRALAPNYLLGEF